MSWTLIESQTLGSSAASVTFSSIPQTYKTLRLVISGRTGSAGVANSTYIAFNGSAATTSTRAIEGSGSAASSWSRTSDSGVVNGGTSTASTFSSFELTIPNYAGFSSKAYSVDAAAETNATTIYMQLVAGLWAYSTPISSVTFTTDTNQSFVSGSSFYLYGLK